jgi:hypothetical protein
VDYLASNHTKQSLRPQRPLGAQIEVTLPRERFSPLAEIGRLNIRVADALQRARNDGTTLARSRQNQTNLNGLNLAGDFFRSSKKSGLSFFNCFMRERLLSPLLAGWFRNTPGSSCAAGSAENPW